MKLESAIYNASQKLKNNNIRSALLDSELIMAKAIKRSREYIILNFNKDISKQDYDSIQTKEKEIIELNKNDFDISDDSNMESNQSETDEDDDEDDDDDDDEDDEAKQRELIDIMRNEQTL